MPVQILIEAQHNRLTTADAVGQELNFTQQDIAANQSYLNFAIDRASSFISNYTNRNFGLETVSESLASSTMMPRSGGFRLVVSKLPVRRLIDVRFNQNSILNTNGFSISDEDCFIEDAEAGFIFNNRGYHQTTIYGGLFKPQPSRYKMYDWVIEYEAGYHLPGDENRDLPFDIEMAAIDITKHLYMNKSKNPDLKSQEIGEASETYFDRTGTYGYPSPFSKSTQAILDRYRLTYV